MSEIEKNIDLQKLNLLIDKIRNDTGVPFLDVAVYKEYDGIYRYPLYVFLWQAHNRYGRNEISWKRATRSRR